MKTGISYFGVRNPEYVKVDLQIIARSEYTHILHTFSEEDLHYYADTMVEIIATSKKYGLDVYVNPWGVGRVFGGEAYSELSARDHSIAQVNNHDEAVVAACPNNQKFIDYMDKWIEFACQTEADTIFWDEPHFYFEKGEDDKWCCRCDTCQKEFRKMYKHTMPNSITDSVKEFRHQSIVKFIKYVAKKVKGLGKQNALCLLPSHFNDGVTQWDDFAKIEEIDVIGTDPYWEKGDRVKDISHNYHLESQKIVELAKKFNKEPQMWIKNYHIQKNNEDSVVEATWAAFNEGVRNIFAWSYLGSSYLSWLRSDDPEKVWELQTDTFIQCHAKEAELAEQEKEPSS